MDFVSRELERLEKAAKKAGVQIVRLPVNGDRWKFRGYRHVLEFDPQELRDVYLNNGSQHQFSIQATDFGRKAPDFYEALELLVEGEPGFHPETARVELAGRPFSYLKDLSDGLVISYFGRT